MSHSGDKTSSDLFSASQGTPLFTFWIPNGSLQVGERCLVSDPWVHQQALQTSSFLGDLAESKVSSHMVQHCNPGYDHCKNSSLCERAEEASLGVSPLGSGAALKLMPLPSVFPWTTLEACLCPATCLVDPDPHSWNSLSDSTVEIPVPYRAGWQSLVGSWPWSLSLDPLCSSCSGSVGLYPLSVADTAPAWPSSTLGNQLAFPCTAAPLLLHTKLCRPCSSCQKEKSNLLEKRKAISLITIIITNFQVQSYQIRNLQD